jgi:hypothetical protein
MNRSVPALVGVAALPRAIQGVCRLGLVGRSRREHYHWPSLWLLRLSSIRILRLSVRVLWIPSLRLLWIPPLRVLRRILRLSTLLAWPLETPLAALALTRHGRSICVT